MSLKLLEALICVYSYVALLTIYIGVLQGQYQRGGALIKGRTQPFVVTTVITPLLDTLVVPMNGKTVIITVIA
jgi:hypothetical protein